MIDIFSLLVGCLIVIFIIIFGYMIIKVLFNRKEKKSIKETLPQLKSYVKEAHNHLVESANNLNKLYEVFNEIEELKQ